MLAMKRELLILRHGKSDWSRPVDDFHRPLKKRGRKNARQMGAWLHAQGIIPDIVISSPAVRASETARIAVEAMRLSRKRIASDPAIYDADWKGLLQLVHCLPKTVGRVLLVGHNTGIEDFVLFLSAGNAPVPAGGKLMPTAALARFAVSGAWMKLCRKRAELLEIVRPRLLAREKV